MVAPHGYAGIEQNTRAFLESLQQNSGPPIYKLSPEQARTVLSGLQAGHIKKLPTAEIEDRKIPGGPTGEISIRLIRPENSDKKKNLPVIIYFHGCGWVLGNAGTHDR